VIYFKKMGKLLAKSAVALVLLVIVNIPPLAAYSLRPLSKSEKIRIPSLSPRQVDQHSAMLAALREANICRLSDGGIITVHEYVSQNFSQGLRRIPTEINAVLAMIESAALAEVAQCVVKNLLPARDEWQEKAVKTIMLSSLPSLRDALIKAYPGLGDTIKANIDAREKTLVARIKKLNALILLPSKWGDLGFRKLTPPKPMLAAPPILLADPAGAI
jgi:hypothetical protein